MLSEGLSRVFSNTTVQKHQFLVLSFLYSPTLTFIHDYWKNHSFDYTDLCWQSNVTELNPKLDDDSRDIVVRTPTSEENAKGSEGS